MGWIWNDAAVPKPYPSEFCEDVVRDARNREPGVTIEQFARDFGVHSMTLQKWMRRADIMIVNTGSAAVLPAFQPHRNKSRAAHAYRGEYAEAFIRLILQLADEDYGDEAVPRAEMVRTRDTLLTPVTDDQGSESPDTGGVGGGSLRHDQINPPTDDLDSPVPLGPARPAASIKKDEDRLRGRGRSLVLWFAAGLVGVVGGAIIITQLLADPDRTIAGASVPSVEVESVEGDPPTWGMNTVFWVPVSAPLEELEVVVGGCDDPSAREWLWEHGSYRHPYQFTVRNVSEETVGISNVVAHGTTTPPRPGLLVTCSDGGQGGELEWSTLDLELADGAVAVLADGSSVSPFFWRDVDAGEKAGVMVYPQGEQDFQGTLTIDTSPISAAPSVLAVPEIGGDKTLNIDWHAIPSDRIVVLTLMRDGYGDRALCTANRARMESCTAVSIRSAIDDLWAGAPE